MGRVDQKVKAVEFQVESALSPAEIRAAGLRAAAGSGAGWNKIHEDVASGTGIRYYGKGPGGFVKQMTILVRWEELQSGHRRVFLQIPDYKVTQGVLVLAPALKPARKFAEALRAELTMGGAQSSPAAEPAISSQVDDPIGELETAPGVETGASDAPKAGWYPNPRAKGCAGGTEATGQMMRAALCDSPLTNGDAAEWACAQAAPGSSVRRIRLGPQSLMAADDDTSFDPDFGAALAGALDALGEPAEYVFGQTVLLERGGHDGMWPELLGREQVAYRRIGALVITRENVAYAELVATRNKPASALSTFGAIRAGRNETLFRHWTWVVPTSLVEDVTYLPIVDSPYGFYPVVEVVGGQRRMRFALDMGAPAFDSVVTALRHAAGKTLDPAAASTGTPREDGLYAVGRNGRDRRQARVLAFQDGRVVTFGCRDIGEAYRRLRDGGSDELTRHEVEIEEGIYSTLGGFLRLSFTSNGLISRWTLYEGDRLPVLGGWGPAPYGEMVFLDEAMLSSGLWGSERAGLTSPSWPPTISSDGELVARDIGHMQGIAGGTVAASNTPSRLHQHAHRLVDDAVDLYRTGRGRHCEFRDGGVRGADGPPWLLTEELPKETTGVRGQFYVEDENSTAPITDLIVEVYDLVARNGLHGRIPMSRPQARHEGLLEPLGEPAWSEIDLPDPPSPRYRDWDLERFTRWVVWLIATHAEVTANRELDRVAGFAAVSGDRERLENQSSGSGRGNARTPLPRPSTGCRDLEALHRGREWR